LVHLDYSAHLIGLDEEQIWVTHCFDLRTSPAIPAGLSRRQRLRAIERLGQADCQGAPPDAWWSGEQVSMALGMFGNMLAEQLHCPIMADETPIR
jgi:hypothetical protein